MTASEAEALLGVINDEAHVVSGSFSSCVSGLLLQKDRWLLTGGYFSSFIFCPLQYPAPGTRIITTHLLLSIFNHLFV